MLSSTTLVTASAVAALLAGCAGGTPAATSAPTSVTSSSAASSGPASTPPTVTPNLATTSAATPTAAPTPTAGVPSPTVSGVKSAAAVGTDGVRPLVAAPGLPTGTKVYPNFFGVHDASVTGPNGWPRVPVGTIRLWDAGVSWRNIETAPGRYDFSTFDAIVRQANLKGAETLVVLGQTPQFYASKISRTDVYGPGAASMPKNLSAWKRYVQAVANRPGVRGNPKVQFQVWNEANVAEFWSGTPAQMALLTKATRDALATTRSSKFLVAPALVTRASFQRTWMDTFYRTKVSGRPVADYVDAVSVQLYPLPTGKPEDSMAILALNKKILAKYRVTKPIWNTEVNYGLSGPRNVAALPAALQAANVSRTYLLNAAAGIKRVYWYSWGNITIANTRTTTANGYTLTPAGKAFGITRAWMVNAQMRSCTRNAVGTYTCTITYNGGVRRVFWNPSRAVTVAVVGATSHQLLDGTTRSYSARTMRLKVGPSPVMIRSAR